MVQRVVEVERVAVRDAQRGPPLIGNAPRPVSQEPEVPDPGCRLVRGVASPDDKILAAAVVQEINL